MPRHALPMSAAKSCAGCSEERDEMSRIGKYPVDIPAGVQVAVASGRLSGQGKLGEMSLALSDQIDGTVEGNQVVVKPRGSGAPARMMWGTTRAIVANMVTGVSTGYSK